jgi:hypothetical protein
VAGLPLNITYLMVPYSMSAMRAAKCSFLLAASFLYFLQGTHLIRFYPELCSQQLAPDVLWQLLPSLSAAGAASMTVADIRYATRRPMFVLYGDSITEFGYDSANGWAAQLAALYSRKVC